MSFKTLLFACLLASSLALPYVDQMLLSNSMIVGREDQLDLVNWECVVCDSSNRPLHAHYIEEKAKDIKAILSVYPTFVVLAFRYTNTLQNVWQDILYANQVVDISVCDNCKVQKAYKNMWLTIVDDVMNDLKEIKKQTGLTQIYITGISLGGGLSVISYIDIKNSGIFSKVNVITFGAPRVGNKNYAAHFDSHTNGKSLRYIVKGDPIVVLPECLITALICNYKHTGIPITCTEESQQCVMNTGEPEGIFEKMMWRRHADPSQKNLGSLVDHITGYKKIYNHTLVEA